MLPLLLSGDRIPDFIQDKVWLDLRTEYFAGIARLVAVVHEVAESRIRRALLSTPPASISDVWNTLEESGFEPSALLESEDFNEILAAGGRLAGPDYAHFDPETVLGHTEVSEPVKALIRRLVGQDIPQGGARAVQPPLAPGGGA
jgi:hypothetical protein